MATATDRRDEKPSATARTWLLLDDGGLLAQSSVDCYRASGPGGQKRNKTSSAVRLRHGPTGLAVVATESRSQHENRARALRRLRHAIAVNLRNPVPGDGKPPGFYTAALARDASLHVNPRHPDYLLIIQHVLDVLSGRGASVGEAAEALRISTGQLVRFLSQDPEAWAEANRLRKQFGHGPLRAP